MTAISVFFCPQFFCPIMSISYFFEPFVCFVVAPALVPVARRVALFHHHGDFIGHRSAGMPASCSGDDHSGRLASTLTHID